MTKKLFIIAICMLGTLLQIGCEPQSRLFADRTETIQINPTTVEPTVEIVDSSHLEQGKLIVSGGEAQIYQCENGDQVTANYYSLSDDRFRFVRIIDPDGKEHFLPHVFSGSGEKYTDNFRVVWWTKGKSGYVQTRQENGDWQITHRECELTEAASVDTQDLTLLSASTTRPRRSSPLPCNSTSSVSSRLQIPFLSLILKRSGIF